MQSNEVVKVSKIVEEAKECSKSFAVAESEISDNSMPIYMNEDRYENTVIPRLTEELEYYGDQVHYIPTETIVRAAFTEFHEAFEEAQLS